MVRIHVSQHTKEPDDCRVFRFAVPLIPTFASIPIAEVFAPDYVPTAVCPVAERRPDAAPSVVTRQQRQRQRAAQNLVALILIVIVVLIVSALLFLRVNGHRLFLH